LYIKSELKIQNTLVQVCIYSGKEHKKRSICSVNTLWCCW